MKKILNLIICTLLVLTATSCIKDWQCECTSSAGTVNEVYKNTKFVTAVDKCNDREAQWHLVNPATTCKIK